MIGGVCGIILALLATLGYASGVLFWLNKYVQYPDKSCTQDSDCKLLSVGNICKSACPCESGASAGVLAVNRKWQPSCPFGRLRMSTCPEFVCPVQELSQPVRCVNRQCEKH